MVPKAINGASLAAIEQQIECRQVRNESGVKLRVDRVQILLPLDTDAVALEQRHIEIAPRGVAAHVSRTRRDCGKY